MRNPDDARDSWLGRRIARRRFLQAAAWLLAPAGRLLAQQPTFTSEVNVVSLLATVRNRKGEIVHNLGKDDFILEEDGRQQAIRYFSQETNLPLTLGLLIDTSMSQMNVLGEEREASYRFLEQVLREDKDQAFVIHFDREVELLQDLTNSRAQLEAALRLLEMPQRQGGPGRGSPGTTAPGGGGGGRSGGGWPGGGGGRTGGGWPGGGGGRTGGGWPGGGRGGRGGPGGGGGRGRGGAGTVLYDAVLLASDDVLKKERGRKAVIILSDGVDTGSQTPLPEAISSAHRADTLAYSILFADERFSSGGFGRGPGGPGRGRYPGGNDRRDGKDVLGQLSRETGGAFYEVSKKQPIGAVFGLIEEELRHQYSLGYTPEASDRGAGFRRIRLTTRDRSLTVQTRDGYYAR